MAAENTAEKKRRRRRREEEEELNDPNAKKGYATPGKRSKSSAATSSSNESGNAVTRPFGGIFNYFAEVKAELDKVVWPTREQTIRLTRIVTIATILAALVLGGLSLIMGELIRFGLNTPAIFVVLFVIIILGALAWVRGIIPAMFASTTDARSRDRGR